MRRSRKKSAEILPARFSLEGEKNVSDIALEVGFAESSTFYRAFRKWTSKSPGAFQREARRMQ